MRIFKLLIVLISLILQSCVVQKEKINGVSFVASREPITNKHVDPVVHVQANYAAIMPFGFIRDLKQPQIQFNSDRQWFGETSEGAKQYIEGLRKEHIKIMLKPQLWVSRGVFTGNIKMENEADWKILETEYATFILEYAELARELNVPIFCIGTELEKFIDHRPEFWFDLIDRIKHIYSGKLTYAANWDEFNRTPFWGQLDYIGIDAYFPVSDKKTPTVEACLKGWQAYKSDVKQLSETQNKPILFTEFGYRSVDYSGKAPWVSDRSMTQVNLEAQTNTMEALFETFWSEDWFAGGFVWKWFHNHEKRGGIHDSRFTPQNKPVEVVIKDYFASYK